MSNVNVIRTNDIPTGPGAAAILAAGIGCAAMGIFALAGDAFASLNQFFTFYKPTGGLSGVSTSAVVVWLVAWFILSRRWGKRNVEMRKIVPISFALLAVGVLLTFPPVMDLLQGR
ncbi:hypothetical protein [Mesorhizobium sp. M1396]|uniref:hypothetical protein n=1 Tax=Mesorhizobium sp. M1396 TaxID=2957095 RepID=UPI003337E41C